MADLVFTDCSVKVNSVDLSDHVRQVTLEATAVALDVTAFGGGGVIQRLGGLKDYTLNIEFYQDYAAAKTHATMYGLLGAVTTWELIPVKGTGVSATNPRISGSALVQKYPFLGGKVGDAVMAPAILLGSSAITVASS